MPQGKRNRLFMVVAAVSLLIILMPLLSPLLSQKQHGDYASHTLTPGSITISILDHDWRTYQYIGIYLGHPNHFGLSDAYDLLVTFEVHNNLDKDLKVMRCFAVDDQNWFYNPSNEIGMPQLSEGIVLEKQGTKYVTRIYKNIDRNELPIIIECDGIRSDNAVSSYP